ncbi:phosphoglycerate mutase-like protein [Mytilinidion resinicola]|uniref:Phosphoglycerate mutase-like protein n=1 Tax=Mytilinidion resinicola TaxID=574789 RepID=A0A6A6YRF6_9PEZI|nr:phosphoglycerate mutase-like protein [Mytilinidion resinicola]KAF2811380.1 phosphoglycerate mutase-like protein [Mytilinidion resinicola]
MSSPVPLVHIVRHGQAVHNVDREYPYRDPPLTELGHSTTKEIKIRVVPNLIIISPMTRTIQTAINAFPTLLSQAPFSVDVQIWPELRETHDAPCNKGLSRGEIMRKFPDFNFAGCPEEWDHPPHTLESALERAEIVRKRLKEFSTKHSSIAVVTHRCFISYLVKGARFPNCETRTYRFAQDDELEKDRLGINCDSDEPQDFGPTLLVPFLDSNGSGIHVNGTAIF